MAVRILDQFSYHHTLAEVEGPSLVFFTSPGCGACRQLKALFEHSAEAFAPLTIFEVDAGRESALTNEFDVFHLPSLFLYRDGEYHAEIQAEPRPQVIMDAVASALAAPAMEAP